MSPLELQAIRLSPCARGLLAALPAVAASLAVAGCGGSSGGFKQTVAAAQSPKATVAAAQSPKATPTAGGTATSSATGVASARGGSNKAGAGAAHTSASRRRVNASKAPPPKTVPTVAVHPTPASKPVIPPHPTSAGPKPLDCLTHVGLLAAREGGQSGVWQANWGTGLATNPHTMVWVDGPYRSIHAADVAVATLDGVEIARRGGLYEVTTQLTSGLGSKVAAVARCLSGSRGASHFKTLSF